MASPRYAAPSARMLSVGLMHGRHVRRVCQIRQNDIIQSSDQSMHGM